jgi:hypothetical protein
LEANKCSVRLLTYLAGLPYHRSPVALSYGTPNSYSGPKSSGNAKTRPSSLVEGERLRWRMLAKVSSDLNRRIQVSKRAVGESKIK